jgi:uncharacterized membrane protein YfcA
LPSAALASSPYIRAHEIRPGPAAWTLVGGIPGTIAGAFASSLIGGEVLLMASGLVLVLVGQPILRPIGAAMRERGTHRRHQRPLLVVASAGLGFFTGTLAVHWSMGHVDRRVATAYAFGSLPSSGLSARFAHRVDGFRMRRTFGWFLCASGTAFVIAGLLAR